jgi:hypothetical protein
MLMRMRSRFFLLLACVMLLLPSNARADEVAPELEGADLRVWAQLELKKLLANLPPNDQQRLVGIYAAFDANTSDPFAQVACDDDGDYVILISDAMLRLTTHIARAASYDELNNTRKVEDYAAFIARSQIAGRRLLPPSPGFYVTTKRAATTYDDRFGEALAFIVARELAHLRGGDLVCPKPTATKESGDDTWTVAEQRKAVDIAHATYPGRQTERDTEAMTRVLETGTTERGAIALLRFFVQLDAEAPAGRFVPTYQTTHPFALLRLAAVKQAVIDRAQSIRSEPRRAD